MRLLDDRSRLFGLVNPVDLVIAVLLLVAAIVAVNVLFDRAPVLSKPKQDMQVVLVARDIDDFDASFLKKGDTVSKVGGSGTMGTLASFEATTAVHEAADAGGRLKTSPSPLNKDVYLIVDGKGTYTDVSSSMGDEQIRQGMMMEIMTPHAQFSTRVLSIKVVR